jgi:hypothetical protein
MKASKADVEFFCCHETGHYANACPQRTAKDAESPNQVSFSPGTPLVKRSLRLRGQEDKRAILACCMGKVSNLEPTIVVQANIDTFSDVNLLPVCPSPEVDPAFKPRFRIDEPLLFKELSGPPIEFPKNIYSRTFLLSRKQELLDSGVFGVAQSLEGNNRELPEIISVEKPAFPLVLPSGKSDQYDPGISVCETLQLDFCTEVENTNNLIVPIFCGEVGSRILAPLTLSECGRSESRNCVDALQFRESTFEPIETPQCVGFIISDCFESTVVSISSEQDRIRNLFSNCLMSRYLSCCIGWCLGRCLDDFNHLVLSSAYRGSFEPFRPRDALFDATASKKVEMLFEPIDARYHPEETVT